MERESTYVLSVRSSTDATRLSSEDLHIPGHAEKEFLLDQEEETTTTQTRHSPSQRRWSTFLIASLLSNLVLLCICIFLGVRVARLQSERQLLVNERGPDPRLGFTTDLQDAQQIIHYEERAFTGALVYNNVSGDVERIMDAPVQYFGVPNETIDEAWEELFKQEWLVMTEDEAVPFGSDLRIVPGYTHKAFELAVTHNLHCLNAVRKMLDPDYYQDRKSDFEKALAKGAPSGYERAHMDHCLDMLFQDITCHVDLSPAPLYYWDNFPIAFGRSTSHVCRDFESVKQWHDRRIVQHPLQRADGIS